MDVDVAEGCVSRVSERLFSHSCADGGKFLSDRMCEELKFGEEHCPGGSLRKLEASTSHNTENTLFSRVDVQQSNDCGLVNESRRDDVNVSYVVRKTDVVQIH